VHNEEGDRDNDPNGQQAQQHTLQNVEQVFGVHVFSRFLSGFSGAYREKTGTKLQKTRKKAVQAPFFIQKDSYPHPAQGNRRG
jgi:hypothetical protein